MHALARPTRRVLLALAVLLAMPAALARAGEINEQGGVAIKGHDPVAYFESSRPVAGSPEITATYKGVGFRFASEANRSRFLASPERYLHLPTCGSASVSHRQWRSDSFSIRSCR